MLKNAPAYSGFAVKDLDQAQEFYADTLGLDVERMDDDLLALHLANDRDTLVYRKPDFVPATYTILNFPVENVEGTIDKLVEAGVTFEQYEGFEQDERGIDHTGPNIAWFKDPAGNILAVHEGDPNG